MECNRSQKRSIRIHEGGVRGAYANINALQPKFDGVVRNIRDKQDLNAVSTLKTEYLKGQIMDTYDSVYNNIFERVQIDNDSLVKANKNEIMDRIEILLNDTSLSNIPDYKSD